MLWYSNPPWSNSGYGVCTRNILGRLHRRGWKVACAPNFGYSGGTISVDGYPILPQGSGFSEVETFEHYTKYGFDFLVTQYDIWPLDNFPSLIRERNAFWIPYVPIDHNILYPDLEAKLRSAFHIITMCDYGLRKAQERGFEHVGRIYHGVDTKAFRVLEEPKGRYRQALGFEEDAFVIGLVQMNKSIRKMIPHQLEGIKVFMEENPDIKTRVYAHTEMVRQDGFDMAKVVSLLGLEDAIRFPAQYAHWMGFNDIEMARMYNGMDVLLSATSSEGFGLPIIEAFACGVPVVATDCTSMTELLQPTPELLVTPDAELWVQIPAKIWVPGPYEIAAKLERALNGDPEDYRKKLRTWAETTFDWELIVDQWEKVLVAAYERKERSCYKPPESTWKPKKPRVVTVK